MKALLGFLGVGIAFLIPMIALLTIGARWGRKKPANLGNWSKSLRANPQEMLGLFYKIRPK
jgi:hypothetical protein